MQNFFHHINNLHQNIKFTMEEENNGEILFWYIGSLHILSNTYTKALTTTQVAREVLFPPCLIEHIPLKPIKMTYA